jgi:hypothetical protein
MADQVLVKEPLTAEMKSAGRDFLTALQEAGFAVRAAFWLFDDAAASWRFVIGSPDYHTSGPLALYRRAIAILATIGNPPDLPFDAIFILDVRVSLVRAIVRVQQTRPAVDGLHIVNHTIDRTWIADAYIYRLNPKRAPGGTPPLRRSA